MSLDADAFEQTTNDDSCAMDRQSEARRRRDEESEAGGAGAREGAVDCGRRGATGGRECTEHTVERERGGRFSTERGGWERRGEEKEAKKKATGRASGGRKDKGREQCSDAAGAVRLRRLFRRL